MLLLQEKRIKWDIVVFIVIVIATFEIPFNLLVGYSHPTIVLAFNLLFYMVFGTDIILNCFTIHEKRFSGPMGINNIIGLFNYKWSPAYAKKLFLKNNQNASLMIEKQPAIAISYLTSGWFLIDFLAVFPFDYILSSFAIFGMSRTLRLARIPRLIRMVRALRALKVIKITNSFGNIFALHPALGRFVIILILVPWLAHIFACILNYAESGAVGAKINSYSTALHYIFITFTTSNEAKVVTQLGQITSIIAVISGYVFFGVFMSNFVTLFEGIDKHANLYEEKKKEWESLFKQYSKIFDKNLKNKILKQIMTIHTRTMESTVEHHHELILGLGYKLEKEVIEKINASGLEKSSTHIKKLKDKFESE